MATDGGLDFFLAALSHGTNLTLNFQGEPERIASDDGGFPCCRRQSSPGYPPFLVLPAF
ncbi:hypothetical protein [Ktedonobacter racemifer]|uniref:hypothetical protein n=1 Tax=Ktedonobacter racemifer TaxID=363277 RepID=UPI0012FB5CAA|nr:hypothetical protein [Ktedonobacter racemifer]